jgi:hypothetical protein
MNRVAAKSIRWGWPHIVRKPLANPRPAFRENHSRHPRGTKIEAASASFSRDTLTGEDPLVG